MTLAEIIEEYDRREALMAEMLPGEVKSDEWRARDAAARRHFPALLAVAKAAVEMREASEVAASELSDAAVDRFIAARAAFDAAVRGDAATGEGR